jgi:hypothetical protein
MTRRITSVIAFKKPGISMSGIEKCHPSELPSEFYNLTNKWSGTIDGQRVIVYAGCMRHNRTKGVLVLRRLPADARHVSGKHCTVPEHGGVLEIIESRGTRLRIAMAKGGSFWFEIPGGYSEAA